MLDSTRSTRRQFLNVTAVVGGGLFVQPRLGWADLLMPPLSDVQLTNSAPFLPQTAEDVPVIALPLEPPTRFVQPNSEGRLIDDLRGPVKTKDHLTLLINS